MSNRKKSLPVSSETRGCEYSDPCSCPLEDSDQFTKAKKEPKALIRVILFSLLVLGLVFLVTCGLSAIYLKKFSTASGKSVKEIWQVIDGGIKQKDRFASRKVNFLLLGLDKRDDELENTLLTDTLIFASLNTANGKLVLIPIPRDLWVGELKTKINALFYYGETEKKGDGPNFVRNWISKIIGQPIDYWMVIDYQNFPSLVDDLGGVDTYIEEGFEDKQYPNPDYIKASDSGEPVYVTVKFDKGWQKLDGENALKFVRSRYSPDLKEGSDLGRSSRQIQLFKAITAALFKKESFFDGRKVGYLYKFWLEKIRTNLEDEEIFALILAMGPKAIDILPVSIPASYEQGKEAILINPNYLIDNQWVWLPKDPSWEELRKFIKVQIP